jgi:hypothetical protein
VVEWREFARGRDPGGWLQRESAAFGRGISPGMDGETIKNHTIPGNPGVFGSLNNLTLPF